MATTRRATVRAIIFKDGKLFCQKLKAYRRENEQRDYWCTPGGGLDLGESLEAGLEREMIEETGIKPKIGRLLFIQQFTQGDEEQMEFFFHVTNADDYEHIDLSATSHGELEIEDCEFIDPKEQTVLPTFLQTIDIGAIIATPETPVAIYDNL